MSHLLEDPVKGHSTEDRRRKKPSTQRELNPRPLVTRLALCRCATTAAQVHFTTSMLFCHPRGADLYYFDGGFGGRIGLEAGDQLLDGLDVALEHLGHDRLRHERQHHDGHLVLLPGPDVRQRVSAETCNGSDTLTEELNFS